MRVSDTRHLLGVNESHSPNELVVAFYRGNGPDKIGRKLEDIWKWNDDIKETSHNYIQWLFPLQEASNFNASAPVLNANLLNTMKSDPLIIENMKKSFKVMMKFYGFDFDPNTSKIQEADNLKSRLNDWFLPGNHNFLRITRILKCLNNFSLHTEAQTFFSMLNKLNAKYPGVCSNSFEYWKQAVPAPKTEQHPR